MSVESPSEHIVFMRRCLELARKGKGRTGLNPLVGAVVVSEGKIIGEGYHREYGGPHAEVEAIASVKDRNKLKHSILYVNLEPCSHYGKTPPCSLLVRDSGIPKVIIGTRDPNPLVSGKGISFLEKSGIQVITGVCRDESIRLNRKFFINILEKRPYVILKWAESRDGFIDRKRLPGSAVEPTWITSFTSRKLVHKWRGEETGIMAGTGTILKDNPSLNLRNWTGNQPVRITIDHKLKITGQYRIMDGNQKTIIFSEKDGIQNSPVYQKLNPGEGLPDILRKLYEKEIASIIVEGGAKLINSFINSMLWDEARVFKGRQEFREGVPAPVLPGSPSEILSFRNDSLNIFFNQINNVKAI